MTRIRQALPGILAGLISISIVFGGLSLAYQEDRQRPVFSFLATPDFEEPLDVDLPVDTTTTVQITATPALPGSPEPTPPVSCTPPAGWVQVTVQAGENFDSLAEAYGVLAQDLKKGICLPSEYSSSALPKDSTIWVPRLLPTSTATSSLPPTACPRPAGWIEYLVKAGDNLYRIGLKYGLTTQKLMEKNCLNSIDLRVNQRLYVPNVPSSTPEPTPRKKKTRTPTPVATRTAIPPSLTPTTPASSTPTPVPTSSPTLSATIPPPPSATVSPTITMTASPSPSPTASETPTITPTPSPSATPSATLSPTP